MLNNITIGIMEQFISNNKDTIKNVLIMGSISYGIMNDFAPMYTCYNGFIESSIIIPYRVSNTIYDDYVRLCDTECIDKILND